MKVKFFVVLIIALLLSGVLLFTFYERKPVVRYYRDYSLNEGKGEGLIQKRAVPAYYGIVPISDSQNQIIHYENDEESKYQEVIKGENSYYFSIPSYKEQDYLTGYILYARYNRDSLVKFFVSPSLTRPNHSYKSKTFYNNSIISRNGKLHLPGVYDFEFDKRGWEIFRLLCKDSLGKYLTVEEEYENILNPDSNKLEKIKNIFTLY